MNDKTLDFLWKKLVPCNSNEEAEKCVDENSEEFKNLMDYIHKVHLDEQAKE